MTINRYSPRRATKRWTNEDCPAGVLAMFDNPNFSDRYTVFYARPVRVGAYAETIIGYRAMSENPAHPQGVGIWGEMDAYQVAMFRRENHGRSIRWSDLPEAVKALVRADCKDLDNA